MDLAAKTKTERNSFERRFVVDPIGFSKIDSTETGESPEIEGFTTSTDSTETRESAVFENETRTFISNGAHGKNNS